MRARRPGRTTERGSAPAGALEAGAVWSILDRVARRLREIHRTTVRQCGVTPSQYVVLRALWHQDGQTPAALALGAGCTRATMTGLVDSLEERGFAARTPHPEDRRSVLVRLTAKGKSLRRSAPEIERLFGGCCTGLSARELRRLRALLEKLSTSLAAPSAACACSCGGPR